jgi:hypothetical protein
MGDNWEDWADTEFDLIVSAPTVVIQKEEELKRLEERKLVEESDNALSKELFETEVPILKKEIQHELQQIEFRNCSIKEEHKIKINKQKENEQKQKEISKKIKESKIKQKRHNELYGELEGEYMYDDYDDKFYN